jgi:hypothetical protein
MATCLLIACGDDDSTAVVDAGPSDAALAGPPRCGNGVGEGDELCDGRDLRGQTCNSASLGQLPEGKLACRSDCNFDVSGCSGSEDGGSEDGGGEDGG